MARATTKTYLALDRWAEIMGINPLWFNSLYLSSEPQQACSQIWQQYDYQNPLNVSREGLARAIAEAESILMKYLGYFLIPDWVCKEEYKTVGAKRPENYLPAVNVRWQPQTVTAWQKHVIAGGQRVIDIIASGATISCTDDDGDGFNESCSVRWPCDWSDEQCDPRPFSFDPCELHVFLPSSDPTLPENEIKPVKIVEVAGNVVISFNIWQTVDPSLLGRFSPVNIDAEGEDVFLTTLDVYRIHNDLNAQQADLIWNAPYCRFCGGSGCAVCQQATQGACLKVTNERLGFMNWQPATFNPETGWQEQCLQVGRSPDIVRLWYYAGYREECPCPDRTMPRDMEMVVAHFAAALLGRDYCDCSNETGFVNKWKDDLALNGEVTSYQNGARVLDNPFGTTRGAVEAWLWATEPGRRVNR